MKKILALLILAQVISCSPFHRMLISPANRNQFLEDSCDLMVVNQLKQVLDSIGYDKSLDGSPVLDEFIKHTECEFFTNKIYPPLREDSAIWLLTIRPALVGNDEIVVGNLYTFDPGQDEAFTYYRRVKEYSQKEEFESGRYVVFTYSVAGDSTTIIKAGKKKF